MKNKSLQAIEDHYVSLRYKGESLRKALQKDKEYQRLLKQRKQKLSNKFKTTKAEKQKYVLSTDADLEILAKCKQLEKQKLSKQDKQLVKLIRTQLEHDWRKQLLKALNKLSKKQN